MIFNAFIFIFEGFRTFSRDAMLWHVSVRLNVRLSQAGVLTKQLKFSFKLRLGAILNETVSAWALNTRHCRPAFRCKLGLKQYRLK